MVLHRRLNYGFNGYEVPPIPRAARSIRKRSHHRNNVGDNQMCAFDLLATVAGEILLVEGQNSATASSNEICENENILDAVKEELLDDNGILLGAKDLNQESPKIDLVVDEQKPQVLNQIDKEIINPLGRLTSRPSAIADSGSTDKTDCNGNKALDDKISQSIDSLKRVEGCSFGEIDSCVPKQEDHVSDHIQSQLVTISEGSFGGGLGHCSSEGPKLVNQEPPALINSDSSMKLFLRREHYSCGSPFLSRDNVKVVSRDDDENSFRCAQRSTVMKTSRSRPISRHRRIRKLLAYRYWRRPQKVKNQDLSDTAGELHSVNQYRRHGFKRQRSQRIYPPKKKQLFYSSPSTSDGVTGYESRCMCSEKDTDISTSAFGGLGHGGMLSVVAGQSTSFQSRESHVKVKIRSFRVPELFIELPETETVGSLKKTVMEAITTLLGGELHVGVVLKGRKIKDDSKTLVQTGISRDNKADGLGFTLEPNRSPQVYSSMGSEDMPLIEMPQPASRSAPAASIAHQSIHASADSAAKDLADVIKMEHDSDLAPAEISMDSGTVDSKALVIIPEANTEALEVVPPPKKSKRYEMAQRRIRRPFSVGEVEALVGAVENLGTGRWRDVKLLAFDNAEHRTYVDLKDKWKTLVHTARISPQQRRGEPVPQELLDRVLTAHDRWSQPQAKQQPNLQPEPTLLLGK